MYVHIWRVTQKVHYYHKARNLLYLNTVDNRSSYCRNQKHVDDLEREIPAAKEYSKQIFENNFLNHTISTYR